MTKITSAGLITTFGQASIIKTGLGKLLEPAIIAVDSHAPSVTEEYFINGTKSIRMVMSAFTSNGSFIRIKLTTGTNYSLSLSHVAIVERSSGAIGTTTPTVITFNDGSSSVTLSTSSNVWSDWIPFSVDSTKTYLLIFDTSTSSGWYGYNTGSSSGTNYMFWSSYTSTYNLANPGTPDVTDTHLVDVIAQTGSL